jgi:hypothetical protein
MEPSRATGGDERQISRLPKPQKQAESVAAGCHRLPRPQNGKYGVEFVPDRGCEEKPVTRVHARALLGTVIRPPRSAAAARITRKSN